MKFFTIFLIFWSNLAFAVDPLVYSNPVNNGSIMFKANVGGTPTDVLKIDGTTGTVQPQQNMVFPATKTLQVDNISNAAGSGATSFPTGAAITGSLTVNGNAVATGQTPVINYVKYSNSKGGTWADTTGVTSSTEATVGNLPRGGIYSTGIKLAVGASGSTGTVYQIPIDNNALNKVMSVSWAQKAGSSYVDGEIVFDVAECDVGYTSCTALPLTTDNTSNQSLLLKASQDFNASFVTSGRGYLQLQWYRLAGTGVANDFLDLNDVVVTVGQLSLTLAPVTPWQSYTPSLSGFGSSPTINGFWWRRVGDSIEIYGDLIGGTYTSALTINFSLPTTPALMLDGSKIPPILSAGTWTINDSTVGNGKTGYTTCGTGITTPTNLFYFSLLAEKSNGATFSTVQANAVAIQGNRVIMSAKAPIVGWSTPLITGAESTEYSFNTSTNTTTSDTTSFGYGPGGALIGNITANLMRTVRFQRPVQPTDNLFLEFWDGSANDPWQPVTSLNGSGFPYMFSTQNATTYGMGIQNTGSSGTVRVNFGQYSLPSGATYGAAGTAWSSLGGAFYWRVRKVSAPALVGHNIADANNVGLVSTTTQTLAGQKTFQDGAVINNYVGVNPEVGGAGPTFQMVAGNKRHQILSPAGAITIKLPSVGIGIGDNWKITNRTANTITIQDSGGFYLNQITYGTIELVSTTATPTGSGSWLVTAATGNSYNCPMSVNWPGLTNQFSNVTSCTRNGALVNFWFRTVFTADGSSGTYPTPFPTGLSWDSGTIAGGSEGIVCGWVELASSAYKGWITCRGGALMYYAGIATPGTGILIVGNNIGVSAGRIQYIEVYMVAVPVTEWRMNP